LRQFIRHPSDIPITIEHSHGNIARQLTDIGYGGLSFSSDQALDVGSTIHIRIDVVEPVCEVEARVVWIRPKGKIYEAGVSFKGEDEAYKIRMVEQICHIEHYRQMVQMLQGRELSSREAAMEWIVRYAHCFPPVSGQHTIG